MKRKYRVTVTFRAERETNLTVWAETEDEAADRAYDIVEGWDNVVSGSTDVDQIVEDD